LPPPNHQEQRRHIMQALHRCIRRNGYAFTSLRDLAEEADMSASHVRYYFDGKDVVLEYYLEHFIQIVRNDLDEIAGLPVDKRIIAIADRFFGERVTRDRISVLFEIFGIAIHNKRLHALKVAHDEQVLMIIQRTLAEAVGRPEAQVEDDAIALHALLVGLSTNMLFDADQTLAKGRQLFLQNFQRLAGLAA
jgi:AcrR family transcriptional regulator